MTILTLRQRIILSHIWSLAEEERLLLDRYKKKWTTTNHLVDEINTLHRYKDTIQLNQERHEVFYVNGNFSNMEEGLVDNKALISIRSHRQSGFFVCLVLFNPKPNQLTDDTPQYLFGEGVQ